MGENKCSIEQCDIFDFMANHVGLTVIHPGGFRATRALLDACHIDSSSKVLDIGCGKGTTSVVLAQEYGCSVTGIDLSQDLLRQATILAERKGLQKRVNFRVADALDLPFPDDKFDVVVAQAILILVSDKKRCIQEALRVTRRGGYLGWLELSWKKPPSVEFLKDVSDVICAYCMLGVETFAEWKRLFSESGVKELEASIHDMEFQGMRGMIADEGLINTGKIMFRYLANNRIRKRMNTMDRFFKANAGYFGYGIYTGTN